MVNHSAVTVVQILWCSLTAIHVPVLIKCQVWFNVAGCRRLICGCSWPRCWWMQRQSGLSLVGSIFCWNHLRHCEIASIVRLRVHGQWSCPITWMFRYTFTRASCFEQPFSPALNRATSSGIGSNLFQPTAASGGHMIALTCCIAVNSAWSKFFIRYFEKLSLLWICLRLPQILKILELMSQCYW